MQSLVDLVRRLQELSPVEMLFVVRVAMSRYGGLQHIVRGLEELQAQL